MKDFRFRMMTDAKFGPGVSQQAAAICQSIGAKKAMILISASRLKSQAAKKIIEEFDRKKMDYVLFTEIVPEPPAKYIDRVAAQMREEQCDVCVAIGGGSALDTGKAVCMLRNHQGSISDYLFGGTRTVEHDSVPLICIPTTAGTGAEVTAAAVVEDTEKGKKLSVTSDKLIPPYALLDPVLLDSMPPAVAASTGMDALTHAIESYTAQNSNPAGDALDLYAMKLIGENLREAVREDGDLEAKGNMLIASFLAGGAFLNCGVAVVHGIAQSIGALAHVSHGLANAILLPYCMKKNYCGNPEKFKVIAEALGEDVTGLSTEEAAEKAVEAVIKLEKDIGIYKKLSEVGVTRDMFPAIVEETMVYRLLANSPVHVDEKYVEEVLEEAF